MTAPQPLWQPSEQRILRSQMHEFMTRMSERRGVPADWESLRNWAVERRDLFWAEMLEFAEIEPSTPASATYSGKGMLGTTWFPDMRLNYARHMLRFNDDSHAIIHEDESGRSRTLSHRQLRAEVARCVAALRRDGVGKGDRVAGFMPNIPEAVIAMLAAASLGASWSSCSPDFGVGGVLDRFGQIEPTVLVTADGYSYGGKRFDSLARVTEMLDRLPSIRRVVVIPYLNESPDIAKIPNATHWRDYLGPSDASPPELSFEEVPFDHPLFIMYSSGTTGVPKCIVHGHGGTLIQHMKELMLHCDLRRGERIFYFTTCGWMMWNWLVSGIGTGAAIVLYEGNPGHPSIDRLWDMSERLKINVFGTSPKFIAACQKAELHPAKQHDLAALRCICSTGSPLVVEQFEWIYSEIKADLQLASICGGTDIISCFILGNPILPVYAGEIQCRGLGMDVQAWTDAGQPIIGEKAELVCASPFPSQPVGFWNDPDNAKYRSAYFEHRWPAARADIATVWRHGDFVEITPSGGAIVYGRSDATLNPGGVRIGTAEIYRIVEAMPEIVESIVIGKRTADDVDICLFVVLHEGSTLDDELTRRIARAIAAGATRRHVPRHIRQATAVPRTISGKKGEMAVTQIIHGEEILNRDALANPAALDQYATILDA